MIQYNHERFLHLRKVHPEFIYEKYLLDQDRRKIYLRFFYTIPPEMSFVHEINILKKDFQFELDLSHPLLDQIAFHIGLIELLRYWKCACSPRVGIKAGALSLEQVKWWKKLYYKGLGEFFYCNSIETNSEQFMQISHTRAHASRKFHVNVAARNLVPIGGGKDSIVSLDLLSTLKAQNICLVVNPNHSRIESARLAGYPAPEVVEIRRSTDLKLLALEQRGYLNGHTPFSASLAFISLFAASLLATKYVIVSNESSANEGNVDGSDINHQFSKSSEFEKDFNTYVHTNITASIKYFSLLRPWNELQIARQFSGLNPDYFRIFKSCNTARKPHRWCHECAKCLFVYIVLFPFFGETELLSIFGENLLDKKSLLPTFLQLIGVDPVKPFECVGTRKEVNAALSLGLKRHYGARQQTPSNLPFLLKHYRERHSNLTLDDERVQDILNQFHAQHLIPQEFRDIIARKM